MEPVSNTSSAPEPENQWQQPPFTPSPEQPGEPVVTGPVLVPLDPAQLAPSSGETTLRLISRLVWPLAIIATIVTRGSLWELIFAAIVVSAILNRVLRELARRRLSGQNPSTPPRDLR